MFLISTIRSATSLLAADRPPTTANDCMERAMSRCAFLSRTWITRDFTASAGCRPRVSGSNGTVDRRSGKKLYTKAADDLVGVFAILRTAMDLHAGRRRKAPPFIGLLTRAEEVGFIGTVGHLELGWLSAARRPTMCISLETSRTLPNALVGKGPVESHP